VQNGGERAAALLLLLHSWWQPAQALGIDISRRLGPRAHGTRRDAVLR
jgi:hypothetical protein